MVCTQLTCMFHVQLFGHVYTQVSHVYTYVCETNAHTQILQYRSIYTYIYRYTYTYDVVPCNNLISANRYS